MEMEDFADLVQKSWDTECPFSDPVDVWQFKIRALRKKVKGWSKNRNAELRKGK
jgi:hypothetical protein